jgi:hypothetical protein
MTVKDLISELKKLRQDAHVYVDNESPPSDFALARVVDCETDRDGPYYIIRGWTS